MTNNTPISLAIDLGASGGRILAGSLGDAGIELEEIHRFTNGGLNLGKRLVWNLLGQWQQITAGLSKAQAHLGQRIETVGADTWGVDYVLLDRQNDLVGPCFNYRDPRTKGIVERSFSRMPREEIFAHTGLQFMEINTAYQLLAMREEQSPLLDIAERFLMVPDFLHWQLSGEQVNEYTNASTTQLLNPTTKDWSREVLDAFDIPAKLFLPPAQPGLDLGTLTPNLRNQTSLGEQVRVILPATHDTGSAVLAVPASGFAESQPNWCYISCGTWSLMGAELAEPQLSSRCQEFNFTNEGGVQGSVRLLKNIAGLWIAQQCREQWIREGKDLSWQTLTDQANNTMPLQSIIDPDAEDFVAPENMVRAMQNFCQRTGQRVPESIGEVMRCALESLVLRYRLVLEMLEELVGKPMETIHLVGGGVQNRLLCQLTADACGKSVVAGPVEATALGNVIMQLIGAGRLESIETARKLIRSSPEIASYDPHHSDQWDHALEKMRSLISNRA